MKYLVYSPDTLTPDLDYHIQQLIGHIWYARMWKAEIITGDDYGASLAVVRAADKFGLKCCTVGINRQPRSGVRPYQRVVGDYCDRDQYMIAQADTVYLLGNKKPLETIAQRLGKSIYQLV
jgi:hypothetical protein